LLSGKCIALIFFSVSNNFAIARETISWVIVIGLALSFFLSFYHRVDNLSALYVAPSYIFSESCRIDVVLWQAKVCA
jgi:hypothetical protein